MENENFFVILKTNFKKIYKSERESNGKAEGSTGAFADRQKNRQGHKFVHDRRTKRSSQKMNEEPFDFCRKKNRQEKKDGKNGRMC